MLAAIYLPTPEQRRAGAAGESRQVEFIIGAEMLNETVIRKVTSRAHLPAEPSQIRVNEGELDNGGN